MNELSENWSVNMEKSDRISIRLPSIFNSGGSQSRAIENEIHQCITDLFLLRKEVLKLAGGMNGNRKTH